MHNRKKLLQPLSEDELTSLNKKSLTYVSLVNIIFDRRKKRDYSVETFDLVGKLLRNSPDFYTLWNFRREILISMYPTLSDSSSTNKYNEDNAISIYEKEMEISTEGIKKNPKSYGAWYHRQWVINRFQCSNYYAYELQLCAEFLQQDQRNFHCWNYRRFVVDVAAINPSEELNYSTGKIQENFSNYSAFHHRSVYIKSIYDVKPYTDIAYIDNQKVLSLCSNQHSVEFKDLIEKEFTIIENAIFTEPDDQSAWWYHQFLVQWIFSKITMKVVPFNTSPIHIINGSMDQNSEKGNDSHTVDSTIIDDIQQLPSSSSGSGVDNVYTDLLLEWFAHILLKQLQLLKSLLEIEENCRWIMNCLVYTISTLLSTEFYSILSKLEENPQITVEQLANDRCELLNKLISIDTIHKKRYEYLLHSLKT